MEFYYASSLCFAQKSLFWDTVREIMLIVKKEETAMSDNKTRIEWLRKAKEAPRLLQDAPAELLADREFVLAAVTENGLALAYVEASLRHEEEILFAALKQNFRAIESIDLFYAENTFDADAIWALAPAELLQDKPFMREMIQKSPWAIRYASPALKADKEIALAALSQPDAGGAIEYVSESLRQDREVALAALRNAACDMDCGEIRFAEDVRPFIPDALLHDKELILEAVMVNPAAILYAAPELQEDPDVLAACRK